MPATNYSKTSPSASGYNLEAADSTDILLLQSGDAILLQNGTDNILLESGAGMPKTNYGKSSPSTTNYGKSSPSTTNYGKSNPPATNYS